MITGDVYHGKSEQDNKGLGEIKDYTPNGYGVMKRDGKVVFEGRFVNGMDFEIGLGVQEFLESGFLISLS